MKGILLAGGTGSRLYPLTSVVTKQMLPVYDKPLLYYPLATLMLAGIREILVISTPEDQPNYQRLLGDGGQLGLSLSYAVQTQPNGIAEALLIGQSFLAGNRVMLILGDNIFFGHGLQPILHAARENTDGATIFAYWVPDPQRFGVVDLDEDGNPTAISEKPENPRSHYAVTGLYFYDHRACEIAAGLKPSARGELEITDINRRYLELGDLSVHRLQRGFAWLDAGTPDALLDAANYVATLERRQGLKIGCIEEIAWRAGWINAGDLERLAAPIKHVDYGRYLLSLLAE
ncbi:MAG: glucose-1-phosphate thymidylyltransferase RfbA [Proteobacteria bacterium]|nr:glucose-1-phosphate thymidylyltransferase RfbA [Pseudomonadota bacterium]